MSTKANKILFVVCAHIINPKCCKILTFKEHLMLDTFFPLIFIEKKTCKLQIMKRKIPQVIKVINVKIKKNRKQIIVERITV